MTYVFVSFRPPYLCPSDGRKHGVSIQSLINLRRTFLLISPARNIAQTWIFARLFEYSSSFIFLILDFICWMVLMMVWHDFNINWLIQKGHVAALVRSHAIGLLPFRLTKEQTTQTMDTSSKTIELLHYPGQWNLELTGSCYSTDSKRQNPTS